MNKWIGHQYTRIQEEQEGENEEETHTFPKAGAVENTHSPPAPILAQEAVVLTTPNKKPTNSNQKTKEKTSGQWHGQNGGTLKKG